MKTFIDMVLTVFCFALVVFLLDYFSKAKDYRRKIQKIAMNNYEFFVSELRNNPDWSFYLTKNSYDKGDFIIDLGLDLSTLKRQYLILNYLRKTPDGHGLRRGAKQLYRVLIGMYS